MERKESIVAGAAIALVIYTLGLGLIGPTVLAALSNRTITNAGSVKTVGVGVYWDQALTSPVSSINWGIIEPGSDVNRTVFIQNTGSAPANLSLTTSNWNPSSASNYMTLSWDYNGQTLIVNEVKQVTFTLAVSSSIADITSFSFDITIAANG